MDAVPSLWPSTASGTSTSRALLAQASSERMTSVCCRHPPRIYVFTRCSDGTNPKAVRLTSRLYYNCTRWPRARHTVHNVAWFGLKWCPQWEKNTKLRKTSSNSAFSRWQKGERERAAAANEPVDAGRCRKRRLWDFCSNVFSVGLLSSKTVGWYYAVKGLDNENAKLHCRGWCPDIFWIYSCNWMHLR